MQNNLSEQPIELNTEEFVVGDMVVTSTVSVGQGAVVPKSGITITAVD